jgi:fluoride exporter
VETCLKISLLSVGGAFGVNARFWLGVWMNRWASPQFPWATFTINVSGSFAIGVLTIGLTRWLPHPNLRLLIITGFLGGYTTFSTFEYDSATLWERGEGWLVAANMAGSVIAGFAAVLLGIALARGLAPANLVNAPRAVQVQAISTPLASRESAVEPPAAVDSVDLDAVWEGNSP